jgi:hypothetical protein
MAGLATSAAPALAATSDVKAVKVAAAGVSLQYPKAWTAVPLNKSDLTKMVKSLKKNNPKLASTLESASTSLSTAVKFYAADLVAGGNGDFSSNVNVIASKTGGFPPSLASFASEVESQYQSLGDQAEVLSTSSTKVSGTPAYRVSVRVGITNATGDPVSAQVEQLFVKFGAGSTIVTVTTDDSNAAVQDQAAAILASVKRIG